MGQTYENGGHVRILSTTGRLLYDYDTTQDVVSSPAVGPFLANGATGIVVGTGTYYAGASDTDTVKAFTTRLALAWSDRLDGTTTSSPALADVSGNGDLDVVEATGAGKTTGTVYVLDGATGSVECSEATVGRVIGSAVTADLSGEGYQDLLVPTTHGVEVLDGRSCSEVAVLGSRLGFQNAPLVTDDPNGTAGITIAGYNGDNVGVVQHYEIKGSSGLLAVGAGSWPMFHHDPSLSGTTSPLPDLGTVVPANLSAQPGDGQVTLSWSPPAYGGTSAPTGYNVYEATAPGHEAVAPVNGPTPVTGTSYVVGGLSVGQHYYFDLTAVNAAGEGAPSAEVSAVPTTPASPPPLAGAPSGPFPATTTTTVAPTPTTPSAPPTTTPAATTLPPVATTAKGHSAKPVVYSLSKKGSLSRRRLVVRLGCRKAACSGLIKLWYRHVLAGKATYHLRPGAKSGFVITIEPKAARLLERPKAHEVLVTEVLTVRGGATVRHPLLLSL